MSDVLMRIGEIAAFFGVSVKAMRVYEKMGVLQPVKVDDKTGYRYYSADQVKQLDALLELRGLGFSLAEIKGLIEGGLTKEQYMEALARKKAEWQEKVTQARDRVETIDDIIKELAHSKPPVKISKLTEDERAQLLSRLARLDINLHDVHGRNILSEILWL